MPLTNSQLDASTLKIVRPRAINNHFDAIPMLSRLRERNRVMSHEGVQIEEPLIYQGTGQAGGFVGDGPLPTTSQPHLTSAIFNMVNYQSPVIISENQLRRNKGPQGVLRILDIIEKVSRMDLDDAIATDLISGNASASESDALAGLDFMVDDDDSPAAYGGVAITDFAGWAATDDANAAVITPAVLQGLIGDITYGLDRPTVAYTTQNMWDKLWADLQAFQQFVGSPDQVSGGFRALQVSGVDIVVEPKMTGTTDLFLLNEDYLNFYVDPSANMLFLPFVRPAGAWQRSSSIIHSCQLTTGRRKAHLRATALTTS